MATGHHARTVVSSGCQEIAQSLSRFARILRYTAAPSGAVLLSRALTLVVSVEQGGNVNHNTLQARSCQSALPVLSSLGSAITDGFTNV